MTQEDKDLLLKDLCGRLPYGVKVETFTNCWTSEKGVCELKEIFKGDDGLFRAGDLGCTIENYKPYLFPLSSMTEEQRKEMEENCLKFPQSGVLMPTYKTFDFFNKYHIDFRGLIEKGLAIDATGKNIY